jgi:hypothetical protein
MNEELQKLISEMEVPEARRADLGWLARNLAIRNSEHPNFEKAKNLIRELRKQ